MTDTASFFSTNFGRRSPPLQLTGVHVRALDAGLQLFSEWVDAAPENWAPKTLVGLHPTVMLLRYGQNTAIALDPRYPDQQQQQANDFESLVNWQAVKFLNVAIASGMRYVEFHITSPSH